VLQIGNKGEAIRKCKNKLAAIANYISRLSLATSASNVEGKAYKRYIIMFHIMFSRSESKINVQKDKMDLFNIF